MKICPNCFKPMGLYRNIWKCPPCGVWFYA